MQSFALERLYPFAIFEVMMVHSNLEGGYMKTQLHKTLWFVLSSLVLVSLAACGSAPTPEPTATNTPKPSATATITPTATNTPRPSPTLRPTRTPNLEATQHAEQRDAETQMYVDNGYLDSADGKVTEYKDFKDEWAQLGYYNLSAMDYVDGDFYMSGHFKWTSAYRNADESGCGFLFSLQENSDHYGVFLDRAKILFLDNQSSRYSKLVRPTRGTDQVKFDNPFDTPAEADFTLIVKGAYAYVLLGGEVVGEYTLAQSRLLSGFVGVSTLSGTNKDFGTRCEVTDLHVWQAE